MASRRARLDAEVARRGLAPSRSAARAMIEAGHIHVAGIISPKPATQISPDQPITVAVDQPRFASRGALKLTGALDDCGVDPAGLRCLDAGAAHGGFTDVLLRRGAAQVTAVDVAYGQFAWNLRNDARVVLLERTNVRHLTTDDIPPPGPELVVADLSFISLTKVLPALVGISAPDVQMLPMVKPQFEVGAADVGRGGVVRDPDLWRKAMNTVTDAAAALGLALIAAAPSHAPGPAGNIEFFLHLAANPDPAAHETDLQELIGSAIARGVELAAGS